MFILYLYVCTLYVAGSQKFDVVITEIFGADCDAVFSYLLQAPLISVIASANLPWASERVGNPENPAYDTHVLISYTEQLTFAQRLINFAFHLYTSFTMRYYNAVTTALNRDHFGSHVPSVEKVLQNTSLIFVNSHFTVDTPRAFVPNTVEIGGIHLPPVKPLPKVNTHSYSVPLNCAYKKLRRKRMRVEEAKN